jgi:uncharacterized membrane-anchored protein
MRRAVILLVVLLQLLLLGVMAGKREYILHFGNTVYLRTAPVDPRDPFRGDFVRLDYPFNRFEMSRLNGALQRNSGGAGRVVYAVLKPGDDDLYQFESLTDKKPLQGTYIKGRVQAWPGGDLQVCYGIEQYFVQQGQGLEIERRMGNRNDIQVPMEVQVALGWDGTAVLKGFRWSRLGIKTEIIRLNRRDSAGQPQPDIPLSPKIRITLQNVSDRSLALVDSDNHCGFALESAGWTTGNPFQTRRDAFCEKKPLTADDLIILKPEQTYTAEMDLADPRWHVVADGKTVEIGLLEPSARFRLVYRSPSRHAVAEAGMDQGVWVGELPSRAFGVYGTVD